MRALHRVAAAVGLLIAATVVAGCDPLRTPGNGTTSSASPSGATTTTSAASTRTPGPVTTSTPASPAPCSAADLNYDGSHTGAASGSLVVSYTFRMVGPSTCRLDSAPVLTYVNGSGRAALQVSRAGTPTPLLVRPGDEVGFTVQAVNGYGGYSPDAPQCANPTLYQQLAVALPDDSSIPLTGASDLTVQCVNGNGAPASVTNWERRG